MCLQQEEEEMLVPHSDLVEGPQPMEGLSLTFTAIYSINSYIGVYFYNLEAFDVFY